MAMKNVVQTRLWNTAFSHFSLDPAGRIKKSLTSGGGIRRSPFPLRTLFLSRQMRLNHCDGKTELAGRRFCAEAAPNRGADAITGQSLFTAPQYQVPDYHAPGECAPAVLANADPARRRGERHIYE